ncbi:MAG TPA: rod shape-determining protein MreD [Clostridia bacterium]
MKFKIPVLGLVILFITLIQSTLLHNAMIYNVMPNLYIIFIVSVALLKGNREGAVIGFFCGLAQDFAAGKVIGFYALLGMYLGLITGSVNRRLYRENVLVGIMFTFASTFFYEGLVYFLNVFMRYRIDMLYALKTVILPEAIYNCIVSIPVYIFAIKLYKKLDKAGKSSRRY